MTIKILQAKLETPYKFFRYALAKKMEFSLLDYNEVFSGEVDAEDLDDVFMMFNDSHPDTMHSMSISDIVINENGMYYCDSFGWKKINLVDEEG